MCEDNVSGSAFVFHCLPRMDKKYLDRKGFLEPVLLPQLSPDPVGGEIDLNATRARLKVMADELYTKSGNSQANPCDWRSFLILVDELLDR